MICLLTKKNGEISFDSSFKKYVKTLKDGNYQIEIKKGKRSEAQNRALHLYFRLLADELNDAGFEIKKTLRQDIDIPWKPELIKEFIWRPVQEAKFGIKSSRNLKSDQIDAVYEIINREIGQRTGISVPFPSKELADQYYVENNDR